MSDVEELAEEEGTKKGRDKKPGAKRIWLITYGSSGPRITIQMLKDEGNLIADECH